MSLQGIRACGPWGPSQVCEIGKLYGHVQSSEHKHEESRVGKDEIFGHKVKSSFESSNLAGLGTPSLHISGYEIVCLFVSLSNCSLLLFASYNAIFPLGGRNGNQLMQRETFGGQDKSVSHHWLRLSGLSLQLCLPRCTVLVINCSAFISELSQMIRQNEHSGKIEQPQRLFLMNRNMYYSQKQTGGRWHAVCSYKEIRPESNAIHQFLFSSFWNLAFLAMWSQALKCNGCNKDHSYKSL